MAMTPELQAAIIREAARLGISPLDLATVISYETAGTFDPWKAGPTTQWGQHRGLIQWGEPQAQQYGVYQGMPVSDQMVQVGNYLVNNGVRPGMGILDIYSAINAGEVGLYDRSDRPGETVRSHTERMLAEHQPGLTGYFDGTTIAPTPAPSPTYQPAPQPAAAPFSPPMPAASGGLDVNGITSALTTLAQSLQPPERGRLPQQFNYVPKPVQIATPTLPERSSSPSWLTPFVPGMSNSGYFTPPR